MWRGPKDLKSADYSVDRLVTRERPLSTESRRSQSFGHNYIDFIATMARWPGRARAAAAGCRMAGARFGMGPVRGHCGRRRRILFPMSLLVALRILVRLDRSRRSRVSRSFLVRRRVERRQHHLRFLPLRAGPAVCLDRGSHPRRDLCLGAHRNAVSTRFRKFTSLAIES